MTNTSTTNQRGLNKTAMVILQLAKTATPELEWKWALSDRWQEWRATGRGEACTLDSAVRVANALTEMLSTWKRSDSASGYHWKRNKLPFGHDYTCSFDYNADDDGMDIYVTSDIGKQTPYDVRDSAEDEWTTPERSRGYVEPPEVD